MLNNVKPVRVPADVQGVKYRSLENPLYIATYKAIGSNPTPMAWSECSPEFSKNDRRTRSSYRLHLHIQIIKKSQSICPSPALLLPVNYFGFQACMGKTDTMKNKQL